MTVNWRAAASEHDYAASLAGGRIIGAGKTVYLANGHDLHSLECRALRQLWLNAVQWCLEAK